MDVSTLNMIKSRVSELIGETITLRDWDSIAKEYQIDSSGDIDVDRDGRHITFLWEPERKYYGKSTKVVKLATHPDYPYCLIVSPGFGEQMIIPYEAIDLSSLPEPYEEIPPPEPGFLEDLFVKT